MSLSPSSSRSRSLRALAASFVFLGTTAATAKTAEAADVAIPSTERAVEMHGFVSPGFIMSTGNNYLAKSKRGSFEFNEVGINFTVPLSDKLRTGLQLFSRDLGRTGNYTPRADWFYLDYRFDDWFGIRAGRVKIPFGLYNDSSDIDAARVPILLPQSVYSIANRDFLLAQTGVEVYGRVRSRSAGALEYRLYGGTIFLDLGAQTTVQTQVTSLDVPFVVGERLIWETPIEGLRMGGSLQALKLDASFNLPPLTPASPPGTPTGPVSISVPVTLWVGSVEYLFQKFLFAAEYSRWVTRLDVTPNVIPEARTISERAYAMVAYHVNTWLHPGVYYSLLYPDVEKRSGREHTQHDIAGTLRFDITQNWLLKLEGHFMSGTATAAADLNDGRRNNMMDKNWGVFLVKTTAHF